MTQKPADLLGRFFSKLNSHDRLPIWLLPILIALVGGLLVTWWVILATNNTLNNQLSSSIQSAKNTFIAIEAEQNVILRGITTTENLPFALIERDTAALHDLITPLVRQNRIEALIVFSAGAEVVYSVAYDRTAAQFEHDIVDAGFVLDGVFLALDADSANATFVDFKSGGVVYFSMPIFFEESDFPAGVVTIGLESIPIVRQMATQSLAQVTLYNANRQFMGSSFVDANPANLTSLAEVTLRGYRTRYVPLDVNNQRIAILGIALPTDLTFQQVNISRGNFMFLSAGVVFAIAALAILFPYLLADPAPEIIEAVNNADGDFEVLQTTLETMTARNHELQTVYAEQVAAIAQRDAVFASIADAIIVRGADGEILLANPAARDLIQSVREDDTAYRVFYYLQEKPERITEPRIIALRDKFYRVLANPVITSEQVTNTYIMVLHDVTEMVQTERAKDAMLLAFSRELRASLTASRGYVDLSHALNAAKFNYEIPQALDETHESLQAMERMVQQVMDASAILSGDVRYAIESFPLLETLRYVIESHCHSIEAKNQKIGTNFPAAEIMLTGDARYLEKAFGHLLHNAMIYTPADTGWIELTVVQSAASVDIFFVDNGAGIREDELETIFERMVRGQSATATTGMGLGLYISRSIITAHQGTIRLQSTVNTGTMVTVTIPIR